MQFSDGDSVPHATDESTSLFFSLLIRFAIFLPLRLETQNRRNSINDNLEYSAYKEVSVAEREQKRKVRAG